MVILYPYQISGGNGGIQMAWLPIVIGIVIGYLIYQKKHQSNQTGSYQESYSADTEQDACTRSASRSMADDQPQVTCSADEYREINEAVAAGERALDSLRAAKSKLDSARAWGIYDILGGGLLSSAIKHGQMNNANEWMEQANRDLRRFAKELRDVPGEDLHVQTGDLISMLDIFCDNFFSDIMVQSRINDARNRIDQVIDHVQETVWALKKRVMI